MGSRACRTWEPSKRRGFIHTPPPCPLPGSQQAHVQLRCRGLPGRCFRASVSQLVEILTGRCWESPARGKRWRGSQHRPDADCRSTGPGPPEGTCTSLGAARGHVPDVRRGPAAGTCCLTARRCPGHCHRRWGCGKASPNRGALSPGPQPHSRRQQQAAAGAAAPRTVSLPICSSVNKQL